MTTEDFIIELFCRIDDQMRDMARHSQAGFYPSELVTIGVLIALKGVGGRAFYRWLSWDYGHWFPLLPERTRLFRRLKNQHQWALILRAQGQNLPANFPLTVRSVFFNACQSHCAPAVEWSILPFWDLAST